MMTLDVVIPTFNRRRLLAKTLESLQTANMPEGLVVTVLVVDNNCTDDTAAYVEETAERSQIPIRLVKEPKQGSSNARNGGIAAGTGELIAFIDDDEKIDPCWYKVVEREFRDTAAEFIGGPYEPIWGAKMPRWFPDGWPAVVGVVPAQEYAAFNVDFPGMLMGGNAVIRRSVFQRIGIYADIGRTSRGLLSMEDLDFYKRLLKHGIHGFHVPDLVIHHWIPPQRLTKKYYRSWRFWHAVSEGLLAKTEPRPVVYLAGIPRYLIGDLVRSLISLPCNLLAGNAGEAFADELSAWQLAGFAYGKHWFSAGRSSSSSSIPLDAV